MHLFGRFTCSSICEHEVDESKRALLSTMHDDPVAMSYVKREGRFENDQDVAMKNASLWTLRLGVVEAAEGDGFDDPSGEAAGALSLTEEEAPCQDVVTIYGDDLCTLSEMMRKEQQDLNG